jgi:hypothetical protein
LNSRAALGAFPFHNKNKLLFPRTYIEPIFYDDIYRLYYTPKKRQARIFRLTNVIHFDFSKCREFRRGKCRCHHKPLKKTQFLFFCFFSKRMNYAYPCLVFSSTLLCINCCWLACMLDYKGNNKLSPFFRDWVTHFTAVLVSHGVDIFRNML